MSLDANSQKGGAMLAEAAGAKVKQRTSYQVRDLFQRHPKRKFSRAQIMKLFADHAGSANSTLHGLYKQGYVVRIGEGLYQRAGKGVKNVPVKRKKMSPAHRRAISQGRLRVNGVDTAVSLDGQHARHQRKDAIVYLSHARGAIKHKDSKEYMLVSLALFTLQGKM